MKRASTKPNPTLTFQEKDLRGSHTASHDQVKAISEEKDQQKGRDEDTENPGIQDASVDIVIHLAQLEERKEDKIRRSLQGSPHHSQKELAEVISHKLNLFVRTKEKRNPIMIDAQEYVQVIVDLNKA